MEQEKQVSNLHAFNEDEWIRLIFLLSDTQNWLHEIVADATMQVPMKGGNKLFRKTYNMSINTLAHIIERHYYKIPRHPETSKFTVPLPDILSYIREASKEDAVPVRGSLNFRRTIDVGNIIGFDGDQLTTSFITVITDGAGRIITAFPGSLKCRRQ